MKKPLYRLNDASRKFWLGVKTTFKEIGLRNWMEMKQCTTSKLERRFRRNGIDPCG